MKYSWYQIRRLGIIFFVTLMVLVGSYYAGYGAGVFDTWKLIAENAEDLLDMQLTARAKMILEGNPEFLRLVLTPETIQKFFDMIDKSAAAKGGIGPEGYGRNELDIFKAKDIVEGRL